MPVIKSRPIGQKTKVRLTVHLTQENRDTLLAYADFIGEENDSDYVLNQLVETVLAKDKDFVAARIRTLIAGPTTKTLSRPRRQPKHPDMAPDFTLPTTARLA